jgi:hypothetical protein
MDEYFTVNIFLCRGKIKVFKIVATKPNQAFTAPPLPTSFTYLICVCMWLPVGSYHALAF